MRLNSKAMTMSFLISMIVSFLGFIILFSFLVSSSTTVVSQVDEMKCQSYLQLKNSNVGKIGDFFLDLSNNCKTGVIESDAEEKEEVFQELADRSYSCWSRYGSGELDFMSNFDTTGKYCFPCTQILYDEDVNFEYSFGEFISWAKENSPEGQNKTYAELINFEYLDTSSQSYENVTTALENLESDFDEFREEQDSELLLDLYLYFGEYKTQLLDLQYKRISSSQENYVIFRYERLNSSFYKVVESTLEGAVIGSAGALVAGQLSKIVLSGPIGAISTVIKIANLGQRVSKVTSITEKSYEAMRIMRAMKRSTQAAAIAGVAGAGGSIGSTYNENYNQYVDIVGQEEYFRICGVKPYKEE